MPRSFTDNLQRTWSLSVTLDGIKRVRETLGLNLLGILDAGDGSLMARLENAPDLVCDVVFSLCQAQAAASGATLESLRQAFNGDTLEQATEALIEAVIDFFPQRRQVPARLAVEKMRQIGELRMELAGQRIGELAAAAMAGAMIDSMEKAATPSASSSGDSADLTLDRSRSGS